MALCRAVGVHAARLRADAEARAVRDDERAKNLRPRLARRVEEKDEEMPRSCKTARRVVTLAPSSDALVIDPEDSSSEDIPRSADAAAAGEKRRRDFSRRTYVSAERLLRARLHGSAAVEFRPGLVQRARAARTRCTPRTIEREIV